MFVLATTVQAQPPANQGIVFIWNDTLMAQSLTGDTLLQAGSTRDRPPTDTINSYAIDRSPLAEPPADGYGFYQGVWSVDGTTFVFLAIEADGPGYRVIAVENGQQHILFADRLGPERGYLVPVGWAESGDLILLERHMLHNLREIRLWQFDPASAALTQREAMPIPDLKGNSASLPGGWVFIGFDTVGVRGYLLNSNTDEIITFSTSFALQAPPASVFELYPVDIVGVVDMVVFVTWLEQLSSTEPESSPTNKPQTPFLYWPLPDHARSITCYPDSERTALMYEVECPGLAEPRSYEGHEGTDIGGKPNGLALGTAVYPAARGIVVDLHTGCESEDITCGDAYGNTVLIEHTRVLNHHAETWFTGYAHLQTVLVDHNTYIETLGVPIALSGDTGLGGAHLHFEVRSPVQPGAANWIDPWDDRPGAGGSSLWIGGNAHPIAAVEADPPQTQFVCQTAADNNIRSGPGIAYDVVTKSTEQTNYEVFQVQAVEFDEAPGDWYHIRWSGPESVSTGWIWADLMADCTP